MTTFEAQHAGYATAVRESFERQKAMRLLGAVLERVAPGEVDIALPFREDLTQQDGFLHAGILATILDSACGYAALTLMPADARVLSIEYKINLLAPARGTGAVARARVLRPGRNVTACAGDVFAVEGGREKKVATMLASMMVVRDGGGA